MLQLGKEQHLEILRDTSVGLYLGDEEGADVLLPRKYCPPSFELGEKIKVFLYKDGEDRWIATTLQPLIQLHQFALLKVKEVSHVGAFVDMGLEKDLFVPFREQPQKLKPGYSYLIYMYVDQETNRLVGSANINRYLQNDRLTVCENEDVDLLIADTTDLGVNVIINNRHKGLIYQNELHANVQTGEHRKGYIHKIREGNKIDVRLNRPGLAGLEANAQKIMDKLEAAGGFLPLHDKSSPNQIERHLEMSKKVFKKSIGILYKKQLIRIENDGIYRK